MDFEINMTDRAFCFSFNFNVVYRLENEHEEIVVEVSKYFNAQLTTDLFTSYLIYNDNF